MDSGEPEACRARTGACLARRCILGPSLVATPVGCWVDDCGVKERVFPHVLGAVGGEPRGGPGVSGPAWDRLGWPRRDNGSCWCATLGSVPRWPSALIPLAAQAGAGGLGHLWARPEPPCWPDAVSHASPGVHGHLAGADGREGGGPASPAWQARARVLASGTLGSSFCCKSHQLLLGEDHP